MGWSLCVVFINHHYILYIFTMGRAGTIGTRSFSLNACNYDYGSLSHLVDFSESAQYSLTIWLNLIKEERVCYVMWKV